MSEHNSTPAPYSVTVEVGGRPLILETTALGAAWLAVYARAPKPGEAAELQTFLERQTAELGSKKAAAAEMVRVLFNTNEFLYVD